MVLLISFVFIVLSILGYQRDNRIVSPLFITPFIWGLLLLLYSIIPHTLYPLSGHFLFSISIWVLVFFLFSFFTTVQEFKYESHSLYGKNLFNIYFYIILIFAPLAVLLLVLEAFKSGPELIFLKLRMMNTGLDEEQTFSLGPLAYIFNFTTLVALLFTFYYDKISKTKLTTVIILAFLLCIVTVARTSLVGLSVGILIIMYFKGKVKLKHFLYFTILFISFIVLITVLRDSANTDEAPFLGTVSIYVFGSMPAYDNVNFPANTQFGENTFRFFYAVLNALGAKFEVQQTILPYTDVPISTNVYTLLFPFYKDFGYAGLGFFAMIYGLLFGIMFKFAKKGDALMVIMYAILFPCLLLQFFGEYIFSNLSTYMQYAIILVLSRQLKF